MNKLERFILELLKRPNLTVTRQNKENLTALDIAYNNELTVCNKIEEYINNRTIIERNIITEVTDTKQKDWLCKICYKSDILFLIEPCGHVMCEGCSDIIKQCPFCKKTIMSKRKVYH